MGRVGRARGARVRICLAVCGFRSGPILSSRARAARRMDHQPSDVLDHRAPDAVGVCGAASAHRVAAVHGDHDSSAAHRVVALGCVDNRSNPVAAGLDLHHHDRAIGVGCGRVGRVANPSPSGVLGCAHGVLRGHGGSLRRGGDLVCRKKSHCCALDASDRSRLGLPCRTSPLNQPKSRVDARRRYQLDHQRACPCERHSRDGAGNLPTHARTAATTSAICRAKQRSAQNAATPDHSRPRDRGIIKFHAAASRAQCISA